MSEPIHAQTNEQTQLLNDLTQLTQAATLLCALVESEHDLNTLREAYARNKDYFPFKQLDEANAHNRTIWTKLRLWYMNFAMNHACIKPSEVVK